MKEEIGERKRIRKSYYEYTCIYREKENELGRLFACPRRRRSEAAEARAKFVLVGREKIAVRDRRKRDTQKEGKKKIRSHRAENAGVRGTGAGGTEKEGKGEEEGERNNREIDRKRRRGREKERGGHNRADRVIIRDEKHLTSAPGW